MAESETERTVLIKIKDHDPLNVCATRLTADSSVFSRLIDDLGLAEIEIEDFEPDVVLLFLTLLEDKKLDQIEDSQFRELHKLSAVYKVYWLVEICRNWLCCKIIYLDSISADYSMEEFLFEECLFIAQKWKITRPINLFAYKRITENNRRFIMHYLHFNKNGVDTKTLPFLLKVAGTDQSIFIDFIDSILVRTTSLPSFCKFLLENINYTQPNTAERKKYETIYEKIACLPEVSKDELKLALKLLATHSKSKDDHSKNDVIIGINLQVDKFTAIPKNPLEMLDYMAKLDSNTVFHTSMVIDLMLFTFAINPGSLEIDRTSLAEGVVQFGEFYTQGKFFKQVSAQYIDMIIELLKLSPKEDKDCVIEILEAIRESETLTTYSTVTLSVSKVAETTKNWWTDSKYTFQCSFPPMVFSRCKSVGKCGFQISESISKTRPPIKYMKYFLTWTVMYTFSALGTIDGAYSAIQFARGQMPARYFMGDLLRLPVLQAAGSLFEYMNLDIKQKPFAATSTWRLDRDQVTYENREVHCHDYFSATEIELFTMKTANYKDGKKLSIPVPLNWDDEFTDTVWKNLLPGIRFVKEKRKLHANYFLKRFLVAKTKEE